jgi:aryl-alcohol dehydrogenase-like predicted oxidoreductase
MQDSNPQRREILGALIGASLASAIPAAAQTRSGDMLYRTLGRTGERVSAIGLGGYHMGVPEDEADGIKLVRTAVDHGINFLDNCWDYHDGKSEVWMGKALRDGYREKVFLMTKFDGRTKPIHRPPDRRIAAALPNRSRRPDAIPREHPHGRPRPLLRARGSAGALLEAKKAGKIRYIGFTGHKDPAVHLRMLEVAEQNGFHFDAAQMPLNLLDAHFRSFAKLVVPKLVAQGVGVLGMKPMAFGNLPQHGLATGIECLHYALNLPTSVVITGCDTMERLRQALEAARTFQPLTELQLSALLSKTRDAALTGKLEPFKTTSQFDGTAQHLDWMG